MPQQQQENQSHLSKESLTNSMDSSLEGLEKLSLMAKLKLQKQKEASYTPERIYENLEKNQKTKPTPPRLQFNSSLRASMANQQKAVTAVVTETSVQGEDSMERLKQAKAVIRKNGRGKCVHSTNTSTRGDPRWHNQASLNSHLLIM